MTLGTRGPRSVRALGALPNLPMSYCHWTSRGLGGSVWQWLTGDVWGRSPETSGNDGLVVEHGHQKISRGNYCGGESRCLLVLFRTYAEPVTPLGRQRDSAAAVRRSPCSPGEQRGPRLTGVERHPATAASTVSCPQRTEPSSLGPFLV